MNKTPSILVDTGFEVDQSGALTEVVTPNVVTTLNAPIKIVFSGTVINDVPSKAEALQEINCPNVTVFSNSNFFRGYTSLKRVIFEKLSIIPEATNSSGNGFFSGCTSLIEVDMPSLTSIGACRAYYGGQFYNCTSLTTVNMPALQTIGDVSNNQCGIFANCTSLTVINFPKLQNTTTSNSGGGTFNNCADLQEVTLGSEGNPVQALGSYTFKNCTQSGLTITIYTTDGAALSGSPWGATNATIEYEEA